MYFDIKNYTTQPLLVAMDLLVNLNFLKQNMICFSFEGGDIPLWGCTYMVLLLQIEWEKEPK